MIKTYENINQNSDNYLFFPGYVIIWKLPTEASDRERDGQSYNIATSTCDKDVRKH